MGQPTTYDSIASLYLFVERAQTNYSFPTSSMASVVGVAF
jgi:hypothetical protein